MSIDHLQDRRTGRPRGSKSKSPALKGLIWASRNIGKDAVPPTEAARYWVDMAKEDPDKFVAAVAALDSKQGNAQGTPERPHRPASIQHLVDWVRWPQTQSRIPVPARWGGIGNPPKQNPPRDLDDGGKPAENRSVRCPLPRNDPRQ